MPNVVGVLLEFSDGRVERVTPIQALVHLKALMPVLPRATSSAPLSVGGIVPSGSFPYYAVFFDDDDTVVHTTAAHRTWSEARDAALAWADHHGSAAMYLRSNGMLPPTALPKKQYSAVGLKSAGPPKIHIAARIA